MEYFERIAHGIDTGPFLAELAKRSGSADLGDALAPGQEGRLRALLRDEQLVDVLRRYPANWPAEDLVRALRPLAPRLYSIASSTAAVGEEAHRFEVFDIELFAQRHQVFRRRGHEALRDAVRAFG